jgi:UDP-glucose 4-epimerase
MKKTPIALVTGGAGFIGSHTVDYFLQQEFHIRVVDSLIGGRESNLEQHNSDSRLVFDRRDIRTIQSSDSIYKDVDVIVHFAGIGDIVPSIDKPIEYMSANVMGTVMALEGARHARVGKFVYAASSSCYGLTRELPTTESAAIDTQYPYALSKYQGEQAVLHWAAVYNLPVNVIRIFNAYGPRTRTTGAYGAVFGVFLKQKLANKPFTVVGDGTQTRDFVFVTDLASAFYLAATTTRTGEIYNVGGGNPQSVNRLVELLGGGEVIHMPKRPGEPDCTWADISKIQSQLGWAPKVDFKQGVAEMLADIQNWQDAPLWDSATIAEATKGWFAALDRKA